MNDHEAGRIAAAMNQLRPDWPIKQLATLLRDERISTRPRRDVCVALAWIACESNSHTPYRVLETGPWWQAVAVEGRTHGGKRGPICVHCGEERGQCEMRWVGDHRFEETNAWMRRRPMNDEEIAKAQEYARQAIGDAKAAREPEPPKPPTEPDPRVEALRAAKAAGVQPEPADVEPEESHV